MDSNGNESFDWAIYADATLAGLSVLIPVPYLDLLSENFFRNRVLNSIALRRNQELHPQAAALVNQSQSTIWS